MFTNVNTQDLRIIAVDEIAIHKGQKYATVFINYETRQVFAVVKGKTQKAVESVFRCLSTVVFKIRSLPWPAT